MDNDKLNMQTPNIMEEKFRKLQELFPNAVTETLDANGNVRRAIDADILRQEIDVHVAEGREERYQFTWPEKAQSVLRACAPTRKTLRLNRSKSVGRDGTAGSIDTGNIYIEGDNLEALKILQETYLGKVKMIYIDPPYNTGGDFIYRDSFAEGEDEYLEESGQLDDEGGRLVQNMESSGRFHTNWLNMIYPRLWLARDLLAQDGVIFISIDDNEAHNLRKCCDDVFGERNCLAMFTRVTKKGGKSTDTYAKNHDYVVAYCRNIDKAKISGVLHQDEGFKHKDEFYAQRGPYKLNQTLDYNTLQYNKTMDYPIEINGKVYVPGGDIELQKQRHAGIHGRHDWVWRWSRQLFDFGYKNGWIEISKSGRIYTKSYLNATIDKSASGQYEIKYSQRTKPITTLDFIDNEFSNDNSYKEMLKLMDAPLFDYAKPTSLVKKLLQSVKAAPDSLVLDFFSGSGTTAHALLQLNAEDGGHRRFIMVQLPEECAEGSEARKAGFANICEIGEERIRRAGRKIREENAGKADGLDVGFRVFKVDSSNMKDVWYTPEETAQERLGELVDNIKEDRTPEDLLFQAMLELGIELSADIAEEEIAGHRVFFVRDGALAACFDANIKEETLTEIAKRQPAFAVLRDSGLGDDSAFVNFEQIFKAYSPETRRRVM